MIGRGLDWVARHGPPILAAGVLLGVVAPPLATLARPLLVPMIALSLTVALVRLDWHALLGYVRRPLLVALLALSFLLLSPLVLWAALGALDPPAPLLTALVLMAAAPPITAGAAIALLLGLDAALVVVTVVLATVLTPLTLPVMALWLLDLEIDISFASFILRLGALVGGAFVAALLIRRLAPAGWLARHARPIEGVGIIALLLFALAIMDGVTAALLSRPGYVLLCLGAAFAANLALQAVGGGLSLGLGRREAVSVGLMAGNRNMGLVLAALADKAHFDTVLFFAMGQVPMYVLPALLNPLYRRILRARPAGKGKNGEQS